MNCSCNTAIVDNQSLNEALETGNGDVDVAVRTFNALRYDDVQSIQEFQEVLQNSNLSN